MTTDTSSHSPVSFSLKDNIAYITLNSAPVNALSKALRLGIIDGVQQANADDACDAIVLSSALPIFSGGADITEFGSSNMEPHLPEVLEVVEQSPKPVIAALPGHAYGGGLELAMACHYRISFAGNKVGLPEVKLGILPGAGGTQRLPRLAGVPASLDTIISGNPKAVHKLPGLFDVLADGPEQLISASTDFLAKLKADGFPVCKTCDLTVSQDGLPDDIFEQTEAGLKKKAAGFYAPFKCLEAVKNSLSMDFQTALKAEQALFMECLNTPQSAAQRHLFFAERQASHLPKDVDASSKRDVRSVAVIGAGTMGGGIAMNFINVGIPVLLVDRDEAAIEKGIGIIRKNYQSAIKKGRLTEEQVDGLIALLMPVVDYQKLSDVDLVIEAVFEDMDVKKQVFSQLDSHCKPGCILASNTSTLDINLIARSTSRSQDVIGMHFFSPANVMQLLEVVRTDDSSDEVIATVMKLAKRIRKTAVLVKVCFGFVGNRMIEVYARESNRLLLEGATPEQVDRVLNQFGMPMGPFTMGDMAGLDIGYLVRKSRKEFIKHDPTYCILADKLVEDGRVGLKAGAGVYQYEAGSRKPIPDESVLQLAKDEAVRLGVEQREISDQEVLERCLFPLINEGLDILDEGIAQRASDIDVIYIFGYGFPVFRGGPMHWAESLGFDTLLQQINHYRSSLGEYGEMWFKPSQLLEKLVAEKLTLADINKD